MKNVITGFLLVLICSSASAQNLTHPPANDPKAPWTKEKIAAIAEPYLAKKRMELGIDASAAKLVLQSSEVWSNYVNEHHFVDLRTEGVPEGFKFDYNWKREDFWNLPEGKKARGLPTAEIIETGDFYYWWERYNYYGMDQAATEKHIRLVVDHELYHYLQWKRIVSNAIVMGACVQNMNDKKQPVLAIRIPATLAELKDTCGEEVTNLFMKEWTDPAHYQCREVEVYSTQIEDGSMSNAEPDYFSRLVNNLNNYLNGEAENPYSVGCKNSMWAGEFMPYVQKANRLLQVHTKK